jgi:hypothetical protein
VTGRATFVKDGLYVLPPHWRVVRELDQPLRGVTLVLGETDSDDLPTWEPLMEPYPFENLAAIITWKARCLAL